MRPKPTSLLGANNLLRILFLTLLQFLSTNQTQVESFKTLNFKLRESELQDPVLWDSGSLYGSLRDQSSRQKRSTGRQQEQTKLVDACQSKVEILTPYYATNSKGKPRTVVNSELIQQAIQVELCSRLAPSADSNCNAQAECGCEQKYKWHRLLVLDPHENGSSRGLFMDWFLFPSSCVCRCKSSIRSTRHFMRAIGRAGDENGTRQPNAPR